MTRPLPRLSAMIASACATLALCAGLTACSAHGSATRTITVAAESAVTATPDVARISLVIASEGESAASAKNANKQPVERVLAALDHAGVERAHVQTTYTDLSPLWDDTGKTDRYEMRTVLSVEGLAIDEVASVVDACVDAGATEVSGPEYYVSDYDGCYTQALADALDVAKGKAEALAQAGDVRLGSVVSISEGYQDRSLAVASSYDAVEEAAADAGGMASLEPGTVDIKATITVCYAIG